MPSAYQMYASKRATASKLSVKMIRDFSSGILKQLTKVLKMEAIMNWKRAGLSPSPAPPASH